MLADTIGERNIWSRDALRASEAYIRGELTRYGYEVAAQAYEARGVTVRNFEAERRGISKPDKIVVVGGHYDSVLGSIGANDNATGAAAVLELARLFAGVKTDRTLRFVAFVNEEPPFFMTSEMGSRVYAKRARAQEDDIEAMLSIETIGYYSDEKGSQRYPAPFSFFFPDTANFIGFVGNLGSRRLMDQAIGVFRMTTKFPSEGVAAPGWMTGIGWSDQWAFWKEGYRGIMVTDTALFRYDEYHTMADTWEKIDYDRTARVVRGLRRVVAEIAGMISP